MKNLVSTLSLGAVLVIAPLAADAATATTIAKPAAADVIKVEIASPALTTSAPAETSTMLPTNLPEQLTFATPNYVKGGVKAAMDYAKAAVDDVRAEFANIGGEVTDSVYGIVAQQMATYIKAADTWPTTLSAPVATTSAFTAPAM